jgi:hypothetical protein
MSNSREKQSGPITKVGHGKLIVMSIFLMIDLGLNSSLDYDLTKSTSFTIILGLFGLQIIIQLSVFLILFLTIADTFLFRVGLLNILLKKTRLVIFFQAIYLMLTIIAGALRLQEFGANSEYIGYYLATDKNFITVSVIQKIGIIAIYVLCSYMYSTNLFDCCWFSVAVLYYTVNIFYTVKLEDPIYYNKDAWIALIRQVCMSICIIDELFCI